MDGPRSASLAARRAHQHEWIGPSSRFGQGGSRSPATPCGGMSGTFSKSAAEQVRVGYIVKMFPRLSETFILNEILELEQQGLPLHIFSLKRPSEGVFHAQTKLVRSPITYLPEKIHSAPWQVLRGQIHVGLRYRHAWWRALRNAWRAIRANADLGAGLAFCQACCLIRGLRGIRHLHAHYANVPAKVALIVHRIT